MQFVFPQFVDIALQQHRTAVLNGGLGGVLAAAIGMQLLAVPLTAHQNFATGL